MSRRAVFALVVALLLSACGCGWAGSDTNGDGFIKGSEWRMVCE